MVVRAYDCAFDWVNGTVEDFTDESGRLLSFQTHLGRPSEVGKVEAGTCQIILKNDDGRYTPKYASGALYGDLKQERRFRLRGLRDAAGLALDPLFYGFITRIAPDIHAKTVAIEMMDWSLFLRKPGFNAGPFLSKRTDQLVTEILDAVGFPSGGSQTLTVSGNEITDVSRAVGTEGDGLSADSSYGIWEASENLCDNGGFETNTTGWTVGGTNTLVVSTAQAKFGSQSGLCTWVDNDTLASFAVTLTAVEHTCSAWVWIDSTYDGTQFAIARTSFAGASGDVTGNADMSKRDQWQRVELTFTPAGGDLSGEVALGEVTASPTAGFVYIDGVQIEAKPIATPYIETDGATASRSAARVQVPVAGVTDETQGWAALRWRPNWAYDGSPVASARVLAWGDDGSNKIHIFYDDGADTFNAARKSAGVGGTVVSAAQTFTSTDILTIIFWWTATQVGISIDGSAFVIAANTDIPTLAATTLDLLANASGGENGNGDVLWAAFGLGTLTDADAATIHAFGDTDPTFGKMPEIPTLIWPADTATAGPTWRNLQTGQTTIPQAFYRNTTAWDALQEAAEHELGGLFYFDQAGVAVFEDRHFRPKKALDQTFTNTLSDLEYAEHDDQVYNRAKLRAGGYLAGIAGSQIFSHIPLPIKLLAGQTLEDAGYSDDCDFLGPAKDVITPVSATDYIATQDQDGTGTVLTANLTTVEFTPYGSAATWNQRNDGLIPLWIQRRQIRGTPTTLPSHARTVVRSGTKLGLLDKEYQRSFRLISDVSLLGAFADYIVQHYNDSQPIIKGSQESETEAVKAQMFEARISARWRITDNVQPYQTQVDEDFFVEMVEHDADIRRGIHKTATLVTTFQADQFWILGESELGTETVLGY